MIDSTQGYLVSGDNSQTLWHYDYDRATLRPLIDYRGSESNIAAEIVFNQRWLVWQEVRPLRTGASDLPPSRESLLWLRDLTAPQNETEEPAADILIAIDIIANLHGFFLPFDCLSLDGDLLVYRHSDFSSGPRITSVCLVDLLSGEESILASVSELNGRRINNCSIADKLVVWDVQIGYQINISGLPPQSRARYNIFIYQLDPAKLGPKDSALRQVSLNRAYSFPVAYGGGFLAVFDYPLMDMNLTMRSDIVFIEPGQEDDRFCYLTTLKLTTTDSYAYYLQSVFAPQRYDSGYYASKHFWRYNPVVGKSMAAWSGNVPERYVVLDMKTWQFIALPVYFSDAYVDELIMKKYDAVVEVYSSGDVVITGYEVTELPWWPNLEKIRVTVLPGLDADYFYFEHLEELEGPYILRIRG